MRGDYIEGLETVRATLTEGRKAGAVDFFIGGDLQHCISAGQCRRRSSRLGQYRMERDCTAPSAKEAVKIRSLMKKSEVVTASERL